MDPRITDDPGAVLVSFRRRLDLLERTAALSGGGAVPVGSVVEYAGGAISGAFMFCDGAAVSRTEWAELFEAIGTTWGAGNGSTTFNIPDRRGRTGVGVGAAVGLTARTLAQTFGTETHLLTAAESGSVAHTHDTTVWTGAGTNHNHGAGADTHAGHTHPAGTLRSARSSVAGAGNQPGRSSSATNQGTVTNDVNVVNDTASAGAHSHAISVYGEAAHTHPVGVSNPANAAANAAAAHPNVQPSIAMNYIIRAR